MNKTDIHPIQSIILCELLFVNEAGFAELNKKKLSSDQFSFHLRQLTDWKLIEKTESGKYRLTISGKEYANRFDTEKSEIEKQAKIGVLIVGQKEEKGVKKYLVQQRLKQPYFGYWGFATGKVRWGETVEEAAKRELKEEMGLEGKVELKAIKHKMDYNQDQKMLEDKYFLVVKVTNSKGNLTEEFEGGKNKWMTNEEILALENLFDGVQESIGLTEGEKLDFVETKYVVKGY
jgi:ADP-ribose pyrophosphatase YjhB (NUDIX family)